MTYPGNKKYPGINFLLHDNHANRDMVLRSHMTLQSNTIDYIFLNDII